MVQSNKKQTNFAFYKQIIENTKLDSNDSLKTILGFIPMNFRKIHPLLHLVSSGGDNFYWKHVIIRSSLPTFHKQRFRETGKVKVGYWEAKTVLDWVPRLDHVRELGVKVLEG